MPLWIIMCFSHILAKIHLWLFLSLTDNSISVLAKHDTFRRQKQEMYFLPIIVTDNGNPPMSSTNTLTIRVCGCSKDGIVQSCNVEAYVLPIGLSMGALIAILACIILLLGEIFLFCIVTLGAWRGLTDVDGNVHTQSSSRICLYWQKSHLPKLDLTFFLSFRLPFWQ